MLPLDLDQVHDMANTFNQAVGQFYEDPGRSFPQRSMRTSIPSVHARSSPTPPLSPQLYPRPSPSMRTSNASTYAVPRPPSTAESTPGTASRTTPSTVASSTTPTANSTSTEWRRPHTNAVIEAANLRAQDETEMQNMLHSIQMSCRIYNPEIEPEHETNDLCDCAIHKYLKRRIARLDTQEMWSRAVLYPGEKPYHDFSHLRLLNNNPYTTDVISSYGLVGTTLTGAPRPEPENHVKFLQQTMALNTSLDAKAKASVRALEPSFNIWELEQLESLMSNMSSGHPSASDPSSAEKQSKRLNFRKVLSVKSSDERAAGKIRKKFAGGFELRDEIAREERSRWQESWDIRIVKAYQDKVGITQKTAELRVQSPLQYLHLLRAGYFEPIPAAWQSQSSNPLRFSISASSGWRGVTPAWRAFANTAEERLYWVLNNRAGTGVVLKSDPFSVVDMARARMASAGTIPSIYNSPRDTCHVQHTSSQGYSKQVMPPFRVWRHPKMPSDDTMLLLDVSGSMNTTPMRPVYTQYLVTKLAIATQPKSKDVAKAIIRRFIDVLSCYDRNWQGYPLITFSNEATYKGIVNGWNLDRTLSDVTFGGRTRFMKGWQRVKEQHFLNHSATSTYHPVYGWQAGSETPNLRLLMVIDGEACDMDEFELDLLATPWAYITMFAIGVEDSINHHRLANRLQQLSDRNSRITYVEGQGNIPERFIIHELLKCHLGQDIPISSYEELEQLPAELPSPLQARSHRSERSLDSRATLETLPVELPSVEETYHWQAQQLSSMQSAAELLADENIPPAELPAPESLSSLHQHSPVIALRPLMPEQPAPPIPRPLQAEYHPSPRQRQECDEIPPLSPYQVSELELNIHSSQYIPGNCPPYDPPPPYVEGI